MMDPSQTQAMSQDEGLEAILVAQKKDNPGQSRDGKKKWSFLLAVYCNC